MTKADEPAPPQMEPERVMQLALRDARVPQIYGNLVQVFSGAHDVTVMFGVNGVPSGIVHMTYPMAKTMANLLVSALSDYEEAVGSRLSDVQELSAMLEKGMGEDSSATGKGT